MQCTPWSFSTMHCSNGTDAFVSLFIVYWKPSCLQRSLSTLHLSGLNGSGHVLDKPTRASTSFWSALQLSSKSSVLLYTLVSSANNFIKHFTMSGISIIYSTNRSGTSTLPWGIPLRKSVLKEAIQLTGTCYFFVVKNDIRHACILPCMPYIRPSISEGVSHVGPYQRPLRNPGRCLRHHLFSSKTQEPPVVVLYRSDLG